MPFLELANSLTSEEWVEKIPGLLEKWEKEFPGVPVNLPVVRVCLLYTSDAADE